MRPVYGIVVTENDNELVNDLANVWEKVLQLKDEPVAVSSFV